MWICHAELHKTCGLNSMHPLAHMICCSIAQIPILGMSLQAGLVPGSYVGMGNNGTGCFSTGTGVTLGILPGFILYRILAFLSQPVAQLLRTVKP